MTQSGQGEEPSARQPREGIVLPSDGGEPLLPGMAGRATPVPPGPRAGSYGGRQDGTYGTQQEGPAYGAAQQDGSYGAQPGGSYGAEPGTSYGAQSGGSYGGDQQPGPYGGHQGGSYAGQQPTGQYGDRQTGAYGAEPGGSYGEQHAGTYGDQQSGPYPGQQPGPYGGQQNGSYSGGQQSNGPIPASAPPSGQAWGTPWGPDQPQPQPQPPAQDQSWPAPPDQTWDTPAPDAYGTDGYGASTPSAPLPPIVNGPYGTPEPGSAVVPSAPGAFASPLPPAVDEGATQLIPPVPAAGAPGGDEGATQFIPPVPAAPLNNEGATQLLPPVGPGALPPEVGGPAQGEQTHFLGRPPQTAAQAGPGPLPPAAGPDAEATQYIPPVTDQHPGAAYGERQPPAEFDNLFRSGPGGAQPAPATQHLPRFAQPQAQPYPQAGGPGYGQQPPQNGYGQNNGHEPQDSGRGGGRSRSRVPLIAAVGIGIVVLGVGAGALLGGGGSDDSKDNNQTVSATAPVTDDGSGSPAADPAKAQAVALDKLLSDSGDSRASVIKAVADVKSCDNLGQAASNLRDAAKQRTQLVTRLSGLSVDKLADHSALTTALTQAWQASASADNHYAAWADQTAGKKGCRKGQARSTGQTAAGNRDSGTASAQKAKAAQLWNAIAKTYGLTQRQPTQL
ncbi:hypothetical protein [Streptomyces sp. NPDC088794]|uniref:hypothetical protein n=1 Tax=Streptomyces sp. NPDC088794 TaxID=3365902 RepID=UPI00382FB120